MAQRAVTNQQWQVKGDKSSKEATSLGSRMRATSWPKFGKKKMFLTTKIVVKYIKSNPGGDLHDRRCSNIFAKIPSQIISILFNKLLLHLSLGNLVQIVVDYRVRYSGLTVYANSKYWTNLFVCLGHFLNFLSYFSPTVRY